MQPSRRTLLRAGVAAWGLAALGCTGTDGAGPAANRRAAARADDTAALQRALDAEHMAVYGYGIVGARLTGAAQRTARSALDEHRARRDGLAALLRARGARPDPAAPAYALPFPVTDGSAAIRLALRLEGGVEEAARTLGGSTDPQLRRLSARLLAEASARQAAWRRQASPSPAPSRP